MNCKKYIITAALTVCATSAAAAVAGDSVSVNLGYHEIPRDALTGSVATVYGYQLARTPEPSLPKTFNGLLPGLTMVENSHIPAQGAVSTEDPGVRMWIRGLSTPW